MTFFKFSFGRYGLTFHVEILRFNLLFKAFNKPNSETTIGIRNSTFDGKRLLFLDYDGIPIELLIPELRYIQDKYCLSEFYLFKSSQKPGGYHVICLDKLFAREWVSIIEETNVDNNYKNIALCDNKSWVLRFMPKGHSNMPEFLHLLNNRGNGKRSVFREKSLAHALFLKNHYDILIDTSKGFDKNTIVTFVKYETLNFVKQS